MASDIYSFGITIWEIMTGQQPFADVEPIEVAIHVSVMGRRPECYGSIPQKVQNLLKKMWHKEPMQRPNAEQIVEALLDIADAERKSKRRSILTGNGSVGRPASDSIIDD